MPVPPKDPARRRRTNRVAGARTLSLVHSTKVPPLPTGPLWTNQALAWWDGVWRSPMAPEFTAQDRDELVKLAVMENDFWLADDAKARKELAAEIRLQRQCFGLTPIDRRRLQWEIDRGEEAEERAAKRKAAAKPRSTSPRKDPRKLLA